MIQSKTVCICIPARYDSVRFPGKPLAMIGNTPMVIRVAKNMQASQIADEVVILTDHNEIMTVANDYGVHCVMTDINHQSGTERIIEYQQNNNYDIYINVQGDEPFIKATEVDHFIKEAFYKKAELATIISKVTTSEELFDYNIVKCVKNSQNISMYFSRQAIPANRDLPYRDWLSTGDYFKHIGLYFYTRSALNKIAGIGCSILDKRENLEQLKWLENGLNIYCIIVNIDNFSVDTPSDLEKINKFTIN